MNTKKKYFLYGFSFGLIFPIAAFIFEILTHSLPFTFQSIKLIHNANALLFMIDSAPVFLGIFAFLGGVSKSKLEKIIDQLREISTSHKEISHKLNHSAEQLQSFFNSHNTQIGKINNEFRAKKVVIQKQVETFQGNIFVIEENINNIEKTLALISKVNAELLELSNINDSQIPKMINYFDEINQYIPKIGEIGSKIDILAINSSIESSKLNGHSKGFRVISSTIREFAEQINQMNKHILKSYNDIGLNLSSYKSKIAGYNKTIEEFTEFPGTIKDFIRAWKLQLSEICKCWESAFDNYSHQGEDIDILISTVDDFQHIKGDMISSLRKIMKQEQVLVNNVSMLLNK